MRTMRKLLIFAATSFCLMSIVALIGMKISSTTWFCLRCHETSNIAATWRKSKHSQSNSQPTACMLCHSRPGSVGFLQGQIETIFSHLMKFDTRLPSFLSEGNCESNLTQSQSRVAEAAELAKTATPVAPLTCTRSGCHNIDRIDNHSQQQGLSRTIALDHVRHIQIMKKIGTISPCMPCHRDVAHSQGSFRPTMKRSCFLCHKEQNIASTNCSLCHHANLPKGEGKGEENPHSGFFLNKASNFRLTSSSWLGFLSLP